MLFLTFISFPYWALCQNLNNVTSWAYQLQNLDIVQVAADTSFQLVVMDYSADGTDDTKYAATDISQIKNSGKKAISYISIGEAEDYRYYWQTSWNSNPPAFLGAENPDWAGNYKVRFWDTAWQSTVFGYIDTIIAQGFDGIYLDIIDAYYYWQTENPEQPLADSLMVQFVLNIRQHVDAAHPGSRFFILPQNGEEIIESNNVSPQLAQLYLGAIDGVGIEDVFFSGNADMDNPHSPDGYRLTILQHYQQVGKKVFNIEYISQSAKINQYEQDIQQYGFVPYYCVRNLDQLCGQPTWVGIPTANETPKLVFSDGRLSLSSQERITSLHLIDIMGRTVAEHENVSLSGLPPGIYWAKVTLGEKYHILSVAIY